MIDLCSTSGCGWACCNYGKDGHIIMLPEEYESATGSLDHLEVIDEDYRGGKKVKCIASNTINCDGGYKPIQCGVYPLWIKSEDNVEVVKSMKCPLSHTHLIDHANESMKIIADYKSKHPEVEVENFIKNAEVDRYEKWLCSID